MESMISWVMSLILASAVLPVPGRWEGEAERSARYRAIAEDVLAVAYDPQERPAFDGPLGRAKSASVMLAVASFESGFRRDVDLGEGPDGGNGPAWCLMQIELGRKGRKGKTPLRIALDDDGSYRFTRNPGEGYGGEDLVKDRRACLRVGLRLIRSSLNACRYLPVHERLSAYASGSCDRGKQASRTRLGRGYRWIASKPAPLEDEDFLRLKDPPPELAPTWFGSGFHLSDRRSEEPPT